ncbi:MAG: hypothetical protein SF182_17145 [Deltaproteobacteria bacterium]|nr:hypothetical protein [Deltaproteobacteria bacterium]
MTPTSSRAAALHLIAALSLLACLLGALSACGGDLVFPGDVPATPTSQNTATAVPTN